MRASLALLVVVTGCQAANGAPAPAPKDDPGIRFEHAMMVRLHMHENFDLLRAIEKLLLRGHREEATALARAIADAPDEPGLGPWAKHATKVRELAAALGRAPNTDEACRRAARLAVACAGCHEATEVVPELSSIPALPPDKPTIEARMARHVWATDRMWEATIGGGTEPWRQGLEVLAATPLPFRDAQDGRASMAKQLQRLADGARRRATTDTLEERGRAYGDILVACATCHGAKVAPKVPSQD
ncbi:MAG: hypothetical protein SFX73_27210 [Kofleriaceae bacterium]|nr:hypothetical protein [Kofleriaceae bacterium]